MGDEKKQPSSNLELTQLNIVAATQPQPGEVITSLQSGNTYTIGERIGEGNFGIVYHCTDTWENELAVKVLKSTSPYEALRDAATKETLKLFALRNPFVTFVHDAFEYKNCFFIVTEKCHFPLSEILADPQFKNSCSGLVRPVARCLLQAVHYLHINSFAHQDIHLGNVFGAFVKDEFGRPDSNAVVFKLGDLGIAKLFDEISTNNTRAAWMLPPEVLDPAQFGPVDYRADIYHSALLLLQLALSQELTFTVDEILEGKPRQLALKLPSPINFALEKALRRRVPFRTNSAMEFWRDLNSPIKEDPLDHSEEKQNSKLQDTNTKK